MNKFAKRFTSVMLSATLVMSGSAFMTMGATTNKNESNREKANKVAAKNIAAQGMVLLENNDNVLPIAKTGSVALFGQGVYNTIAGGTGSGAVNERATVKVREAFKNAGYNVVNEDAIAKYEADWRSRGGGGGGGMWGGGWTDEATYDSADVAAAAAKTDTAVYVIARNSGEGSDRNIKGSDYYLSEDEAKNLEMIGKAFDKVIVVLNVGGVIDTNFFNGKGNYPADDAHLRGKIEGLDALFLMSQGGMTGAEALVEVLNGTVNPSGKLATTWPVNIEDNPSTATFGNLDNNQNQEVYNDDIYVGYRYYDTWGVPVAYEFGYGSSYTSFDVKADSVTVDADKTVVKATVTNTGAVAGKDVVEVYFSAPAGKIDKPYQELAAYAKTDLLAPGKAQTLTITYKTTEMGSYDEAKAAYVMEAGDYIVRVGDSSRNTHVAAKLNVAADQIVEQYSNLMVPVTKNDKVAPDAKYPELKPISPAGAKAITYAGEAEEIAKAKTAKIDFSNFTPVEIKKENEDVTVYVSDTTETDYLFAENKDGAKAEVSRVERANSNSSDYTISYNETVKKFDGDYSKNTLLDVYNGKITVEQFVSGMTLDELAHFVNGNSSDATCSGVAGSTWRKNAKGLIPVNLSDGPAGIRINQSYNANGTTLYQFATAWPIGTCLAQTWDVDQVYAYGRGVGEEMEEFGIGSWLAPGMNIHRNPLCGRNFEYYSEDPVVVGITGTAATLGVQSNKGTGVTIKHYAVNSQETNRNSENNTISERALREIYLKGFEMVVKQAKPMAIMTSYNQNNGRPAANDYDLCTAFARNEWGFNGMIMTDWGGGQGVPMYEMHAGNDLVCPGSGYNTIIQGFNSEPDWDNGGFVNDVTVAYQDQDPQSPTYMQTLTKTIPNWGAYVLDKDSTTTISHQINSEAALNDKAKKAIADGYAEVKTVTNSWGSWTWTTTNIIYKVRKDENSATNIQVISLGDVQKSAINICNFVMRSIEFATYYNLKPVALNDANADILESIVSYEKGKIVTDEDLLKEQIANLQAGLKFQAKKTAIKSLKSTAKKTVTVKVKKVAGATGYEIKYSKKANMKAAKTVKTTTLTRKIKKLASKKRIFVKARAYKVIGGTTYYTPYTCVKSVKVK